MSYSRFVFKCPHCGCDTIMNRRRVRIASEVRVIALTPSGGIDVCDTDDREDEIDMSDQTPLDACCAQCGHHWYNLADALDHGAFIKEENN